MLHTNYFIINHLPPVKTPIFAKVNDISENTCFFSKRNDFECRHCKPLKKELDSLPDLLAGNKSLLLDNHIFNMFYKVISPLVLEMTIDTNFANYGQTLDNKDQYEELLSLITRYSDMCNLPLDFFFSINNGLAALGDLYLQQIPRSVNKQFELISITKNPNHKDYYIRESDLISFVDELIHLGILPFYEGYYLWEYICEAIRILNHPKKPCRADSFFLFGSLEDCKYYMEAHKFPGKIVSVEIIEGPQPFKADMNLWDAIPNYLTLQQAKHLMHDYWQGRTSSSPIFEFLFQGKCKLSPLS